MPRTQRKHGIHETGRSGDEGEGSDEKLVAHQGLYMQR